MLSTSNQDPGFKMRDHAGETGLNAILYAPCAARISPSSQKPEPTIGKSLKMVKKIRKTDKDRAICAAL
jgi:hypothetical protein